MKQQKGHTNIHKKKNSWNTLNLNFNVYNKLEDTARYVGLLLAPAEGFGLRAKKDVIMLFWPIFGNCWCPVATLVTFSSNISNFERNPKKTKKSK